ncbi:hypothetical protein QTP88_021515 [Uroleucon formosanum]
MKANLASPAGRDSYWKPNNRPKSKCRSLERSGTVHHEIATKIGGVRIQQLPAKWKPCVWNAEWGTRRCWRRPRLFIPPLMVMMEGTQSDARYVCSKDGAKRIHSPYDRRTISMRCTLFQVFSGNLKFFF